MSGKNLIYFTIGHNPEYVKLLELCLESIDRTCQFPEGTTDVLVICDEDYIEHVQHLCTGSKYNFIIMLYVLQSDKEGTSSPVSASLRKVRILQFPIISKYDKILYLDSDIIVCKDLQPIFDAVTEHDVLYACAECDIQRPHDMIFFSLLNYTKTQLDFLYGKGIMGFNCGQFAFRNSDQMRYHFTCIQKNIDYIKTLGAPYFYEQSFMNHQFNLYGSVNYMLTQATDLTPFKKPKSDVFIAHFANVDYPLEYKLQFMRKRLAELPLPLPLPLPVTEDLGVNATAGTATRSCSIQP